MSPSPFDKSLKYLILCRGRSHKYPRFSIKYSFVDKNPNMKPDIVADISSTSFLSKLVNDSVRVIIYISTCIYPNFITLLRKIQIGGKIFIVNEQSNMIHIDDVISNIRELKKTFGIQFRYKYISKSIFGCMGGIRLRRIN